MLATLQQYPIIGMISTAGTVALNWVQQVNTVLQVIASIVFISIGVITFLLKLKEYRKK